MVNGGLESVLLILVGSLLLFDLESQDVLLLSLCYAILESTLVSAHVIKVVVAEISLGETVELIVRGLLTE